MAENKLELEEFKYPDEVEDKLEVEVESDVPPEDRGKTRSQPEFVEP